MSSLSWQSPLLWRAPTARMVLAADSDTESPETSELASPSMSAPSWVHASSLGHTEAPTSCTIIVVPAALISSTAVPPVLAAYECTGPLRVDSSRGA